MSMYEDEECNAMWIINWGDCEVKYLEVTSGDIPAPSIMCHVGHYSATHDQKIFVVNILLTADNNPDKWLDLNYLADAHITLELQTFSNTTPLIVDICYQDPWWYNTIKLSNAYNAKFKYHSPTIVFSTNSICVQSNVLSKFDWLVGMKNCMAGVTHAVRSKNNNLWNTLTHWHDNFFISTFNNFYLFQNVDHKCKHRSKKGMLPFVELNGEEIADSEHIIDALSKKFEKVSVVENVYDGKMMFVQNMPAELSQDQKNVEHAMITMVENHLHWWVTFNIWNLIPQLCDDQNWLTVVNDKKSELIKSISSKY